MQLLQIDNKKGKIRLNDAVHKESADKLIDDLGKLYGFAAVEAQMQIGDVVCAADDALESVEVEINSPGGSVFEGHRIYNALREMSSRGVEVVTVVNGIAASMGSVILMAGDKRKMTKGGRIMIHEAKSMAQGDAREMRTTADLLEGISDEIAEIYAHRSGGDKKKIRKMMLAETWMDATQAKEAGFIHDILNFDKKPKAESMNILAKLFPDNSAQIEQIEAALAEADLLRAELETVKAEIVNKDEVIAQHVAEIATRDEKIEDVEARLAEADKLANENAQTITDLQGKLDEANASAAEKAAEIVASIGHKQPVDLNEEVNSAPTGVQQYLAAVEAGDRAKAAELFAKHKTEIFRYRQSLNK